MTMPAPDYPTLYDFETQLEDAFVAILKANSINNVFPSRDAEKILTPGVIFRCVVQSSGPMRRMMGTPSRQIPISFEALIIAEIITTRKLNGQDHGVFRGRIRYLLSAAANLIDSSNMPFLQIVELLPAGGTPQLTDEKQQDRSNMNFTVKFAIRDDAWPSP